MDHHCSPSAWHQWVTDNGPRLLLFARQQTRCEHDARDIFQDALFEVWKKQSGRLPEPAQVFATIRHRAVDLARRDRRRLHRDGAWLASFTPEPWFSGPSLESTSIETELRNIPPEYAEVVLLKIWGNLTFEQIAATLAINPSTAASRYRYGLRDLRQVLTSEKIFVGHKSP